MIALHGFNNASKVDVQVTKFNVMLKPGNPKCDTADKYLANGKFWYSLTGNTYKTDSCCGTSGSFADAPLVPPSWIN